MIKRIDNAIFSNNYIIFVNEDANSVKFFSGEMGLFSVDHNKINLDVHDFDEDDPKTIIHVRPIAWRNRFQKKACKKSISKELMPVPWHPTRWWDSCMPEMKKRKKTIFDR